MDSAYTVKGAGGVLKVEVLLWLLSQRRKARRRGPRGCLCERLEAATLSAATQRVSSRCRARIYGASVLDTVETKRENSRTGRVWLLGGPEIGEKSCVRGTSLYQRRITACMIHLPERGLLMAEKQKSAPDDVTEILRDMLIVQLAIAGVRQKSIRTIVGCDIHRVSRICRHIKTSQNTDQE